MPEPIELVNDIALLPRTRRIMGHALVFDPNLYRTKTEIAVSDYDADQATLSVKERAERLAGICADCLGPTNPDWTAERFFEELSVQGMLAALRFFDNLRRGFVPSDATLLEMQRAPASPATPTTPESTAPSGTASEPATPQRDLVPA